ncbi:hypothetical protein [Bacteriophage sp.]|nr:hypothetical protein [Bacteriophage sp.]
MEYAISPSQFGHTGKHPKRRHNPPSACQLPRKPHHG